MMERLHSSLILITATMIRVVVLHIFPRVRKRARVIGEVRVSRSGVMRFPPDLHCTL